MWKVIVADDEPFIREALKEMIPWDELGCHLAEALKNGKEVVNAVEKYKPDIVILDIQMPLMTGMEAAQWIHENYPDIVVVLLTAYEDFKYAQQAIVFQVKRYVIKSNLFEDLPKALEEISEELAKLERQREDIEKMIQEELQPKADALKKTHEDYRVYIQIQHELNVIADFATSWETDLRELPSEDESESEYHPKELFDKDFQERIDKLLKDALTECSFPNLTTARLNLSSFDVEINGRKKQSFNGQGYTSFLNSIIAMSFRQYLSEYAVYDPGLLVIDTPLLGLDQGVSDVSPESMRASLYTYFTNHQDCGQVILLDNMKDVPAIDFESTGTNVITFTKGLEEGRYGFLMDVTD